MRGGASHPSIAMKLNEKQFVNYEGWLARGYLFGVGITPKGNIAVEMDASSGNVRIAAVYLKNGEAIIHSCPATQSGKPCWHLAAAADIYAMAYNRPLLLNKNVSLIQKPIKQVSVAVDITPEYLQYKGLPQKRGDFSVFNYQPITATPQPTPINNNTTRPPQGENSWAGRIGEFTKKIVDAFTA
ncbi:MAG: hypothetical protein K9L17_13380 [Clostridiales bacterium]|nr:hypothetical protein [Clostridiales bacterium]MCF8023667.1 hypothetical protein [Clostridiales bacterium]